MMTSRCLAPTFSSVLRSCECTKQQVFWRNWAVKLNMSDFFSLYFQHLFSSLNHLVKAFNSLAWHFLLFTSLQLVGQCNWCGCHCCPLIFRILCGILSDYSAESRLVILIDEPLSRWLSDWQIKQLVDFTKKRTKQPKETVGFIPHSAQCDAESHHRWEEFIKAVIFSANMTICSRWGRRPALWLRLPASSLKLWCHFPRRNAGHKRREGSW